MGSKTLDFVIFSVIKGQRLNVAACAYKRGLSMSDYIRLCINTFENKTVLSKYGDEFQPTPLTPIHTKRPETVGIALTSKEKEKLYKTASNKGLALSAYVRMRLWDVIGGEAG